MNQDLRAFFAERHFIELQSPDRYDALQWGSTIQCATQENFEWEDADIVIVGCGEWRGEAENASYSNGPNVIREQFYQLYNWHQAVKVADLGNILQGQTVDDTRAALRLVLHELKEAGKTVLVLGGSHDLTLEQYGAFKMAGEGVNVVVADMLIDLDETETVHSSSFLYDIVTAQPSFLKKFGHIGFQSFNVNPRILETLDKLRFDCYRLGVVREDISLMEPTLRDCHLFSFDISAIAYAYAPANRFGSPNGLNGEEACTLTRFAGMGGELSSIGIYGYDPLRDVHQMTAKQIAQMIWYFIDGYQVRMIEPEIKERGEFVEFHVKFTSNDTLFLRSKRTGRWWMELPNQVLIPCSYKDYLTACNDEIPERWLREQERLL